MNDEILVIDDDREHNDLLRDYLGSNGFNVHTVDHPETGIAYLEHHKPDAIILDIMLPDMDGFTACREIRKKHTIPILMLTAKGDVQDRIVGLEIGADDYLSKPFEPRELVARLRSILRRYNEGPSSGERERFGVLEINYPARAVTLDDADINLTSNEYLLFEYLVRNRGRVLDRGQLVEHLRGIDHEAFDRSIDMLVSRLRQKLRDDSRNPKYIKTVTGTGYVFICRNG